MRPIIHILTILLLVFCGSYYGYAQTNPDSLAKRRLMEQYQNMQRKYVVPTSLRADTALLDSNAMAKLKNKMADSVKHAAQAKLNKADNEVKAGVKSVTAVKDSAGKMAANKVKQINDQINGKIKSLQKPKVQASLAVDNQTLYQPPALINSQKFVNNINVKAQIQALGIPFSFNIAQNHATYQGLNSFNNSLFKVNYNNGGMQNILKGDLQQYANYKDQFFSGLDLSDYMHEKVFGSVTSLSGLSQSSYSPLQSLSNDPSKMTQLLQLNQTQLHQQLLGTLNQSLPDSLKGPAGQAQSFGTTGGVNRLEQAQLGKQITKVLDKILPDSNKNKNKQIANIIATQNWQHPNETVLRQQLTTLLKQPASDTDKNKTALLAKTNLAKGPDQTARGQLKQVAKKDSNMMVVDTLVKMVSLYNKVSTASNKQAVALNELRADSLTQAITKMKVQMAQNGLDVNRVMLMEKYLSGGGASTSSINELVRSQPDNGMQALFTHVNDLKVGNYSLNVPGGIQNSDLFVSGSHVNLQLGNNPFSFGYGTLNDLNSLKDANYQNSVYSVPRNITYLSSRLNQNYFGKVNISVISSFGNQFSGIRYATPTLPSNTVALTLSKSMNLGTGGNLLFDVSKSNTLFANKFEPGSEAILDKKAGANYSASNDLFQALAFGVQHHADLTDIGMSDNVYFNYAGMGYQNPATAGNTSAKIKYGGNVKKSFYHNKYNVSLRADIRDLPLSYTNNDKWRNYQFEMDNRYQISNHFNVSLKYISSGTDKHVDGLSTTNVYQSQKLQLDANTNIKVGKYYTITHVSIGNQNLSNMYVSQSSSNLLMVNYAQSLILPKSTLSATVFYNKEMGDYKLIGNMLNSDLTYQYTIFKAVTLSSGVTYLNNVDIAKQAGVRQGIQLVSGKHFDITSYLDVRKNLITPLYPDLYASCRGEVELKYFFKIN